MNIKDAAAAIAKDEAHARQRAGWAEFVGEIRAKVGYVPEWVKRRSQEVEFRIAGEAA